MKLSATNLFDIRDEITSAITDNLQAVLSPAEKSHVFDLPTSSMEALSHYQRGRQLMAGRKVEELKQARLAFEQAVEADPEFALAWVGVADTNLLLKSSGHISSSEGMENRKQAVEKALALDDQLGEAWVSLGMMYADTGKPEEAEAAYLKAIELSPNYAQAYHWYATMIRGPENREKSLTLYHKAAQLDPLSSIIQLNIGRLLTDVRGYDEALDHYERMLQMDPGFYKTYWDIGRIHWWNGRLAESVPWFRKALEINPRDEGLKLSLASPYLALGDFKAIAGIREQMVENQSPGRPRVIALDTQVSLAQWNWREALDVLYHAPPELMDHPWTISWKVVAYLAGGDLKKAREYFLKWKPGWDDRGQWQQLLKQSGGKGGCVFASILVGTGDEALGRELLVQARRYWEETLPGLVQDSDFRSELPVCYLLDGSDEKALDFVERQIEHGHVHDWLKDQKLAWWEPLREHPRYIALESRVEKMLAEQRELLRQMDESGTTVP